MAGKAAPLCLKQKGTSSRALRQDFDSGMPMLRARHCSHVASILHTCAGCHLTSILVAARSTLAPVAAFVYDLAFAAAGLSPGGSRLLQWRSICKNYCAIRAFGASRMCKTHAQQECQETAMSEVLDALASIHHAWLNCAGSVEPARRTRNT